MCVFLRSNKHMKSILFLIKHLQRSVFEYCKSFIIVVLIVLAYSVPLTYICWHLVMHIYALLPPTGDQWNNVKLVAAMFAPLCTYCMCACLHM